MKDNIIKIEDVANKETVSIKTAAKLLGSDISYHTARNIILTSGEIGYIKDENTIRGTIFVVKEDILNYKRKHFVAPKRKI